jgi:glycosyltransferase involved in cell wall biosynthesis
MYPDKISLVIPVYNSEDCLLQLNTEIEEALLAFPDYELVLVNDKSTDNSWEKIMQICTLNPRATGINLRKNFGQDNALLAGLRYVSGTYVVIMDDDLQHSPSDIIGLYTKCREGFDVCYARFPVKKQSALKNFGSWLNGRLAQKLLNKPPWIYLSPFKIIRKTVVDEVVKFPGPFPYIDATLLAVTSNLVQVEVSHHERYSGKGNYSLVSSFLIFVKHATNYSIYPLQIVSGIGLFSAVISFVLGIFYLIQYFYDNHRVEGWVTIVILLTFFGGMILMSLGLIGEYVGRSFLALNGKPQFIIESIIGNDDKVKNDTHV